MKHLIFLAVGMFVMGLDSFLFAGLLPLISSSLNTSIAAVGQGITFFDVAYVISAPLFAIALAGKPARFVLGIGLLIFMIGNALTIYSFSLTMFLLSRAVVGIGAGLFTPLAVAAATDFVEEKHSGKALSFVWGANSAGVVIGIPIAIWLANICTWPSAVALVLVISGVTLLGIIGTPRIIGSTNLTKQITPLLTLKERLRPLTNKHVFSVIGITFLTATGSLGIYTYITLLGKGSPNSLASILFAWSLGGLLGSTSIGVLVDRLRNPQWVMVGILALLIVVISTLPILSPILLLGLIPYFLWGALGWAVVTPQQHTLMKLQNARDNGATLAALNSSAIALGSGFGSAFGGVAISFGAEPLDLPIAAGVIFLLALMWHVSIFKDLKLGVSK